MKFILLYLIVHVVSSWTALPPTSQWSSILRSLQGDASIDAYVETYVNPYEQLQQGERNELISGAQIKISLLAFADILILCIRRLKISKEAFSRQNPWELDIILKDATSIFDETPNENVASLRPIFSLNAVRSFIYQRLDDIIVASSSCKDLAKKSIEYRRSISFWRRQASRWNDEIFQSIIPKNLDFTEIKRFTAIKISKQVKSHGNITISELSKSLYSLGNGAMKSISISRLTIPIFVACMCIL